MKKPLILIMTLFASALACRADIISQTVDFGTITGEKQLYFNQFNTALGTLNSVTLSWTINSTISSASITNQNTGTVNVSKITFTNTVEGYVPSVGDAGDLVADVAKSKNHTPSGGNVTLNPNQSYTVSNINFSAFTQTDSYTSADANFSAFQGTGSVPLYLTNTFGATPTASGSGVTTSWLTSITGSSTGSLGVAYSYSAAPIAPVPEPPALILGCGGLLFMSAFAFKQRRRPLISALAA